MKKSLGALCLLVVTLSVVAHDLGPKIDAINKQALSLKNRCDSIKEFVDCLSTNCCGGSGEATDCACAPTLITASTETIDNPGSYCLSENVITTITVTTNAGVAIDLNGYTASSLILGSNCKVKNGTVYSLSAGSNTFVSNIRVSGVTGNGAGSSVVLVDCSRLTSLQNVERVVMARCTGDGASLFQIFAGVKEVTLYDSVFSFLRVKEEASQFERLALYRSLIQSEVNFYNGDSLREFVSYQSVIGGQLYFQGVIFAELERILIEESQIKRGAISINNLEPQKVDTLIQRSVFENGISVQKFEGLVMRKCQLGGGLFLMTDNNVHVDNVSVTNDSTSAISVAAGKNILLTDCCTTASTNGYAGYTTASGTENLNLIRCYAKGCYDGFNLNSAASCLVKDCVCDGAQNVSFSGDSSATRAVGNIALSVGGVPATNYSPVTVPFDIDVNTIISASSMSDTENTLERSAWRNMSFELP